MTERFWSPSHLYIDYPQRFLSCRTWSRQRVSRGDLGKTQVVRRDPPALTGPEVSGDRERNDTEGTD